MWLWCNVSIVMRLGWGRAESSAAGHPFARAMGAWSGARATRGVNQNGDRAEIRGSDNSPTARVLRPRCSHCHLTVGQGSDVSVAQPVVDEGEQLAGRGDVGDVAAAAALDPFGRQGDVGSVQLAVDGLHNPPPHQVASL